MKKKNTFCLFQLLTTEITISSNFALYFKRLSKTGVLKGGNSAISLPFCFNVQNIQFSRMRLLFSESHTFSKLHKINLTCIEAYVKYVCSVKAQLLDRGPTSRERREGGGGCQLHVSVLSKGQIVYNKTKLIMRFHNLLAIDLTHFRIKTLKFLTAVDTIGNYSK